MPSIRRRLLAILIGLFLLTWLAAVAGTYAASARSVDVLFDAELANDADVLLTLAQVGFKESRGTFAGPRDVPPGILGQRKMLAFQIWRDGRLVLRSDHAPGLSLPNRDGYATFAAEGRDWRSFTARSPDRSFTVWMAEPVSVRSLLVEAITRDALFPLVLAIPLLAAVVWWGVGRGLVLLDAVATEVAQRSPSNLRPVDLEEVPAEIHVMVEKLNTLLVRLRDAFDRERRFTADAAHEIRTPLATIKTHAQVALRSARTEQRREAMEEVIQGVDRTTRLVEQLLTLARLDRETLEREFDIVDLGSVAAEIIAALDSEAAARRISVSLSNQTRDTVRGNPVALGMMIRNLVDNAIRYTPAGGAVHAHVSADSNRVALTVTDNGPGIASDEQARVFDRFYRGANATSSGCGLGLSIVKRVVELHNATIALGNGPGGAGLRVRVEFPRAAA